MEEETKEPVVKKKKVVHGKRFDINIQRSNYAEALLKKLIEETPGWNAVIPYTKSQLWWTDGRVQPEEILEWLGTEPSSKMTSRYPNIKFIDNKDVFADNMRMASMMDPDGFDFIPPTFVFPGPDIDRFREYS